MRSPLAVVAVAVMMLALASSAAVAEMPKAVPEGELARIVAGAPKCPTDLDLGVKTKLIDFIDCTNPADPHDFRDQGTSRIDSGPAGTYRVTAAHRHAFFSYAFRTAGRDKPVLLVVEYPDDADRTIGFTTHDSMRPQKAHVSFTQETGVLTGGAMPRSNAMRYFTLVNWPQDDWTPLIVMNYGRSGGAGAASRIWVYAIEGFEPLQVEAPDPANQRVVDAFFCLAFLAARDNFGWQSKQSSEHLVDYCRAIGVNRVTMEVYANQGWGAMCTVPAWDIPDDKEYLDDILAQMDRKGGVDFIAGIVADGMYGDVKAGGKLVRDLPKDEARKVILQGFDQLIDRYGKYKCFKGFALGSMETIGFYDTLAKLGLVEEVVAHIKQRRPDFTVLTYVGNVRLQTPFFSARRNAQVTNWDVISGFEKGKSTWSVHLAEQVHGALKEMGHDPAVMRKIKGLDLYEMTHPNDHRLHDLYTQEPRQGQYYDVLHSQQLAQVFDTPYGAVFDTFSEGHIGLNKDVNFWYSKDWTAPDFNFAGPLSVMPLALLEARRDRLAVSAGAWTMKHFGYMEFMRKWAKAFRSLPPVEMKIASVTSPGRKTPSDVVTAWAAVFKDKRYVAVQSRIPFKCGVQVGSLMRTLAPYELAVWTEAADGQSTAQITEVDEQYVAWLRGRMAEAEQLCKDVAALNPEAAPAAYGQAVEQAAKLLQEGRAYAADCALAYGLVEELKLRQSVLTRPELAAPRLAALPAMKGDLDAWPKEAGDVTTDASNIMGHIFFPNSWRGPKDTSVRLRLGHDGTSLFVGIAVTDDKLLTGDNLAVWFSKGAYRDWRGNLSDKPDVTWSFVPPPEGQSAAGNMPGGFVYTSCRTATGYVIEGQAPLAQLGLEPGGSIGMLVVANEEDNEPNKAHHSWARKLTILLPHQPNFTSWSDVRNCGTLRLGK